MGIGTATALATTVRQAVTTATDTILNIGAAIGITAGVRGMDMVGHQVEDAGKSLIVNGLWSGFGRGWCFQP